MAICKKNYKVLKGMFIFKYIFVLQTWIQLPQPESQKTT